MRKLIILFIIAIINNLSFGQTISSNLYGTRDEFIICWNSFGSSQAVAFDFNKGILCGNLGCSETYSWTSSDFSLGQYTTTSGITIYFNNTCKSGKIKCTRKWKDITGFELNTDGTNKKDANGNNIPIYGAERTESKEVIVKVLVNQTVTLTGDNRVDCNLSKEITYKINGLCSHETYSITWVIPSYWQFKNHNDQFSTSLQTAVLKTDNYTGGQIIAYVNAQKCTGPGSLTPINVTRDIKTDLTIQSVNNSDFVAFNSISIFGSTSSPWIGTHIKAGKFIKLEQGSRLYSEQNGFTKLRIGTVQQCNASKLATGIPEKDTNKLDSNLKLIESKLDIQVNLYPNPAKENLTLKLNNLASKNLSIQIFDLMGRLVNEESVNDIIETNLDLPINISSLNSGNYIMNLKTDKEQKQLRFIKD